MKGRLFIIPIPISDNDFEHVITSSTIEISKQLRHFVVEKVKTSRQFLRKIDRAFPIDDSIFYELNKHNDYAFEGAVLEHLKNGTDVGVMSEAGYPGIADPGNGVVQLAHKHRIKVVPLIGPSSIFLALASSGLNGQGFTFNGYLAKGEGERIKQINSLCQTVIRTKFAQIFIETPYRNQSVFDSILKYGVPDVKLTVAKDITGGKEYIVTQSISDWKNSNLELDKSPCVFILGQY